jgi:ribosomal protein S12 methylthiotransferase
MMKFFPAAKPSPRSVLSAWACPKALTDSELILTQLSAEGYQTSKTFEGADLVIVNTCGFIDDAVARAWTPSARRWQKTAASSSPAAWAPPATAAATWCADASERAGGDRPARHAGSDGRGACNLPKPHDPFVDLVPNSFGTAGLKLTPKPLCLSEDQRRLQPPLHLLHHPVHARRSGLAVPSAMC